MLTISHYPKKKSLAHSYGKIILLGEHFVVHGKPAIACALNDQITVTVEPAENNKFMLIDNSKRFPHVPPLTWEICRPAMGKILKLLNINTPLKITLGGKLIIPHTGIGSSAAHLVGLTKALSNAFELDLSNEEINKIAFEGEKVIHGNPSGIDNTAATYGGAFWFQKKSEPTNKTILEKITLQKPIKIMLIESGQKASTKEVINALGALKQQQPTFVKEIFDEYHTLAQQGYSALTTHDLKKLGKLMNKNHELLQHLTLSCEALDKAIEIACDAGALGAKLTGTGRGGLAIALFDHDDTIAATRARELCRKKGFFSTITHIS